MMSALKQLREDLFRPRTSSRQTRIQKLATAYGLTALFLRNNRMLRRPEKEGETTHGVARLRNLMPGVSRAAVSERSACRLHRTAHTPQGRLERQRVRRLPYAEDRNRARRCQRSEPHLPLQFTGRGRALEDAELLQLVSYRQNRGLGHRSAEIMEGVFSLARGQLPSPWPWVEAPGLRCRGPCAP